MLSTSELSTAQQAINTHSKGKFILSEIYGTLWSTIKHPTLFGKNFKASVDASQLQNIRFVEKNCANHIIYEIF